MIIITNHQHWKRQPACQFLRLKTIRNISPKKTGKINVSEEDYFTKALRTEPPQHFNPNMIMYWFLELLNRRLRWFPNESLLISTQFKEFFGTENIGVKAGILTAIMQVGGVVALPFVGPAVDTWGRKSAFRLVLHYIGHHFNR